MKNLLLTLIMVLVYANSFSQNRAESNQLMFDASKGSTKNSGVSNKVSYSSSSTAKLSRTSNILYYGVPKVAKRPAPSQSITSNTQQDTPPPVIEQKKMEEPTRQVAMAEEPAQNSSVNSNPPPVPVLVNNDPPKIIPSIPSATTETKGAPQLGGEFTIKIPRFLALVIGVSKYKYAESGQGPRNLDNAANDAEKLYKTLITKYNFDTTNSKFLRDPNRQQIVDAFDQLTAESNDKDNVLVFYAGHGNYDSHTGFGYWLPADSKLSTKSDWIANSTVKDYMGAVKSKHTLLITDACFGGSIFKSRSVDAATFLKFHELYKDPSKRAMTSGNLSEVPDKSIFIDQLLKKLNENELDYLPSAKLYNQIYQPVADNATEPQFGVILGAGDEGGDFIFIRKK